MRSKRKTTFAKLTRERKLQERRELKREKKEAAAAERRAQAEGGTGDEGLVGPVEVAVGPSDVEVAAGEVDSEPGRDPEVGDDRPIGEVEGLEAPR